MVFPLKSEGNNRDFQALRTRKSHFLSHPNPVREQGTLSRERKGVEAEAISAVSVVKKHR